MTDGINFSGKLSKQINLDDINVENMTDDKKKDIASLFNTQKTGADGNILTTDELVVLNDIDANHNGQITDEEIGKYYDEKYANNSQSNPKGVQKAEYIAYVKALAKQNESQTVNDEKVGNTYTVQLGENLNDLVIRVLKANGNTDPAAEDIEECKRRIIELNRTNGSIKFDGSGNVRWLIAGQQLILPTDTTTTRAKKYVKDQNNKEQVESKYLAWNNGRGSLKSFSYKIDDDGKTYEVRGNQQTEFDTKRTYNTKTGTYTSATIKEEDAVNYNAIKFKEGKEAETKTKIKTAIDAINSLTNKNNIDGTPTRNGNEVEIKLKDGGRIVVNYGDSSDKTKITDIYYYPKDSTEYSVKFEHTNKLYADGIEGGIAIGGVKDWAGISKFVSDALDTPATRTGNDSQKFSVYNKNYAEGLGLGGKLSVPTQSAQYYNEIITKINKDNVFGVFAAFQKSGDNKENIYYNMADNNVSYNDLAKINRALLECADEYNLDTQSYRNVLSDTNLLEGSQKLEKSTLNAINRHANELAKDIENASKNDQVNMPNERVSENANKPIDRIYQYKGVGEQIAYDMKNSGGWSNTITRISRENVFYAIDKYNSLSNIPMIRSLSNAGISNAAISGILDKLCSCADSFNLTNTTTYAKVKMWADYYKDSQEKAYAQYEQCDTDVKALIEELRSKINS